MTIVYFLEWLQNTQPVSALRAANHLVVEVTEVCHVLGLVSLLAAVALLDLRLLGIGLRQQAVALVARSAAPMLWGGLALTLISGSVLFLSGPVRYFLNPAFPTKMGLLALALAVQWALLRRASGDVPPGPVAARSGAAVSLLLWFSVGLFGRAIGYI